MMEIKFKGDKEVRILLDKAMLATSEAMAKAITMTAIRVEASMKEKCAKASGYTADSISTELVQDEKSITAKVGASRDAYWAKYLEYGTGVYAVGGDGRRTPWTYFNARMQKFFRTIGMKAQPFIFPALRANKAFARDILKAAVTEGWGKITR